MTNRMNVHRWRPEHRRMIWCGLSAGVGTLAMTVLTHPLMAQSEESDPQPLPQDASLLPVQPMVPPTTVEEADAMMGTLYPSAAETPDAAEAAPANSEGEQTRPWKLTFHGTASATYDTNIFIASSRPQADLLFTLSPGAKIAWGDWLARENNFLVFDYTLSGLIFVDHPSQDTFEQQAELDAQWRQARLTISLQVSFQDLSSADVDVGNRTRRRLFETALLNKYDLSEKTFLEANLYNNVRDYTTAISSTEWIGRFWYNYRSSPKVTFGVGSAVGYLAVENSPGQTFEQVLLRTTYTESEKLSFEAYGGIETRQLETGDRAFPILSATGSYQPFAGTAVNLSAYRRVQNSALLQGENYTITGFTAEATRAFRAGCEFVFGVGYNYSDYSAASQRDTPPRQDSYFFVRPSVRWEIARRLHAELSYLYQQNDSTHAPTAFHDAQVCAQIRIDY